MKTMRFILSMMILFAVLCAGEAYGQWSYNGTHIYNNNAGNVGIGNNAAAKLLYVGKNMTEPTAVIRNFGGTGGATFEMIDDASGADWKFKATLAGGFKIRDNTYGLDVMTFEPGSAANAIYVDAEGEVGIGNSSPIRKLDVNGKVRFSYIDDYSFLYLNLTDAYPNGNTGIIYDYLGIHKTWIYWRNADNMLRIATDANGARNDLVIQSDGDIGIGTGSPVGNLEVFTDDDTFARFGMSHISPHYYYHDEVAIDGDGQSALYAFRTRDFQNDGSAYTDFQTNSAVKGYNLWGDLWTFGVSGFSWTDFTRCGGVLGAEYTGVSWGSLGYKNSGGNFYGGYFSSTASGGGKSSTGANIGIGLAAWGDLMGADIHGKIYGVYAEGENYALFSNGPVFKNNLDIHLQENENGTNTVLYTYVSTNVCVQTSGVATLSSGIATIAFDPAFTSIVSANEPVVVTVTPVGETNGVHLSNVSSAGFTIVENNAGRSNVTVNFIAIGKRAGYENPNLPAEVIEAEYINNIARGLTPDADLEHNGEGLYYENGQLVVGRHPSTFPDPNLRKEKPVSRVQSVEKKGVSNDSAAPSADSR